MNVAPSKLATAARADEGRKNFFVGTHRVVSPQQTLDRVMPLAARMGVTRVAMLTGLDCIGIPVAAAIRPNSRSVAQHQGKGTTPAAAKASAVMEAVETFHAETLQLPLRLASRAELAAFAEAADPDRLPRAHAAIPREARLLWVEATDLVSGRPLWVPHELVTADFCTDGLPGAALFQATTNGLASGNHWLEAVTHGLYEVVERDAAALFQAAAASAQDARAVDPATIDGEVSRRLLPAFARAGVAIRVWDIATDIRLPAFQCLVASDDPGDAAEPELGFGCHADRDVALARALTEAAQARLTMISGAREDIGTGGFDPRVRAQRRETARRWMEAPARRDFRAAPSYAGASLRHDLDRAMRLLGDRGLDRIACVDLSRAEFGVPVVRVIVPGLEGPWTPAGGEYTPGARAPGWDGTP